MGRGTDEIKMNDVTGRLRRGDAGLLVEMGRPGVGAYFRDIEKVAMAKCCEWGVFNPVRAEVLLEKAGKGGK